nr:ABC transporter permease subunit [Plastoroseomonas hellenica]
MIGFVAGAGIGVLNGVAFFRAPVLRDMLFPIFVVSQTIPVIAFGALVVLWFGNTLMAKAVIAFYLTFFPVTVNTLLGLNAVDPRQVALLRSFGASGRQVLLRLQLPMALPQIFVALRLAASLSLVGAIVGEWFGDTTGIGVLLLQAMYNENVVALWAAILCSALLGTGFYALVALAERRIVFWGAEQ